MELNIADKAHFFGIFESNPKNFSFLSGDRKLIKGLVEYVIDTRQKDTESKVDTFLMPRNYNISRKDTHRFSFGLFYGHQSNHLTPCVQSMNSVTGEISSKPENLKEQICRKLRDMTNSLKLSKTFDEENIRILNTGTEIKAVFRCIFCEGEKSMREIIIQVKRQT